MQWGMELGLVSRPQSESAVGQSERDASSVLMVFLFVPACMFSILFVIVSINK